MTKINLNPEQADLFHKIKLINTLVDAQRDLENNLADIEARYEAKKSKPVRYEPKDGNKRLVLAILTAGFLMLLALCSSGCASQPEATAVASVGEVEVFETTATVVANPVVTP